MCTGVLMGKQTAVLVFVTCLNPSATSPLSLSLMPTCQVPCLPIHQAGRQMIGRFGLLLITTVSAWWLLLRRENYQTHEIHPAKNSCYQKSPLLVCVRVWVGGWVWVCVWGRKKDRIMEREMHREREREVIYDRWNDWLTDRLTL